MAVEILNCSYFSSRIYLSIVIWPKTYHSPYQGSTPPPGQAARKTGGTYASECGGFYKFSASNTLEPGFSGSAQRFSRKHGFGEGDTLNSNALSTISSYRVCSGAMYLCLSLIIIPVNLFGVWSLDGLIKKNAS